MSLLTKEQQEAVDVIKNYALSSLPVHNDQSNDYRRSRHMCMSMLSIIDDLQSRHIERKQYTEQELTEILQKDYPQYWQGLNGDYFQKGFHEAAQRFGALKAEP